MKRLSVTVFTDSEGYGKALARGLAAESERTEINVVCTEKLSEDEFLKAINEAAAKGSIAVSDRVPEPERTEVENPQGTWENAEKARTSGSVLFLSEERDGQDPRLENMNVMDKLSPVRDIFGRIKEFYFKDSGTEFCRLKAENEKIIGILPYTGGCGATAVSLALGRWLALISDKPVLYVNAGERDDYRYYVRELSKGLGLSNGLEPPEKRGGSLRSKKEMLFHLAEGLKWNVEDYCVKDVFNVWFFKPEARKNCLSDRRYMEKLLASVTEKKLFQYILIDGIRKEDGYLCDLRIDVINSRDARSGYFKRVGDPTDERDKPFCSAYNFAEDDLSEYGFAEEETDESRFRIPLDKESFLASRDIIEISMEGLFSDRIRPIAEKLSESQEGRGAPFFKSIV